MRSPIPNVKKFRRILRFLLLIVACPAGSLNGLAAGFIVEPWLQATSPLTQPATGQELPFTAEPVSQQSLADAETGSLGYGARAIGAMIVVLALIWISMILLKRYMPHRFGALGHQRRVQVLETLPIGEKRTVTLIRVDNEQLLLASTPGSVSLLKELRAALDPQNPSPSGQPSSSVPPNQDFAEVLADEVRNPLQQLVSLRRDLEARSRGSR
jgi:flagellar biosynthetic protein FliO